MDHRLFDKIESDFRPRTCLELSSHFVDLMEKSHLTGIEMDFTSMLLRRSVDLLFTSNMLDGDDEQ